MSAGKGACEDSGHEIPGVQHSMLLDSVFQLDYNRRIKPPVQKELSSELSEFSLAPIKGTGIQIKALAKSIERQANLSERKVLNALKVKYHVKSQRTLSKPLEPLEAEKIRRNTGYSNLKQKISQWDALVQTNRHARCLKFPMNIEELHAHEEDSGAIEQWKTQTPTALEAEIYEILGNKKSSEVENKEENHIKLTLQELKERRKEISKLRIQQSYQEAKARRQKRIKSKKYHRILRREKVKKQLQDFERLQKTDPEAALKQLELLERARAEERMTLRHKNTGQWARSRLVRAKYDPLTRQQLAEQLAVSRDLMKVTQKTDSGDEEHEAIPSLTKTPNDVVNPWIAACPSSEVKEFVRGYRKYWEECNKKAVEDPKSFKMNCEHEGVNLEVLEHESLSSGGGNKEIAVVSMSKRMKVPVASSESWVISKIHNSDGKVERVCKGWHKEEIPKLKKVFDVVEENKNGNSNTNSLSALKRKRVSLIDEKSLEIGSSSWVISSTHNSNKKVERVHKEWHSEETPKSKQVFDVVKKNKNGNSNASSQKAVKRNKALPIDEKSPEIITSKKGSVISENLSTSAKIFGTSQKWVVTGTSESPNSFEIKQIKKRNVKIQGLRERKNPAVMNAGSLGLGKKGECEVLAAFSEVEKKLAHKAKTKLETLKASFISKTHKNKANENTKLFEEKHVTVDSPLAFKRSTLRANIDEELDEASVGFGGSTMGRKKIPVSSIDLSNSFGDKETHATSNMDVDPKNFIEVAPKLVLSAFTDLELQGEENDELRDQQQQKTVVEAFAADDVIDDFKKEKEEIVNRSSAKDIDLTLPGWGSWAGAAMDPNKRKKKRLLMKAPPAPRRHDSNKVRVIINEENAFKIPEHQVSEIPFSFSSVSDFEASIRAPVGNTWIPETAYRKLIHPAVTTKMGSTINPLNEEFLMKKKIIL